MCVNVDPRFLEGHHSLKITEDQKVVLCETYTVSSGLSRRRMGHGRLPFSHVRIKRNAQTKPQKIQAVVAKMRSRCNDDTLD